MAEFRLSMTAASRSAGRKVVAMAAYRSGQKLEDMHYGQTQDYEQRGGVLHSEIVLPANAPDWAKDRAALWSGVEDREKADNAVLAREVQLSLPHEFTDAQRIELTQEFARHVAGEYGFAVDMNIHTPSEEGDQRNHHAHLMITARAFDEDHKTGWSKTKDRRFNDAEMKSQGRENAVSEMREVWETMQNRALERADIRDERGELVQVDRRSYEARGLEIEPTIKLGPAATEMVRRGEPCDRGAINDAIKQRNAQWKEREETGPHDTRIHFERSEIRQEVGAIQSEMAELFAAIAERPGAALQFKRRERELTALHKEVQGLLNGPSQSERMNDLLLSGPLDLDRQPAQHWRWDGLDEFNRELAEPVEDERETDRDKGKGKQPVLLDTYPRQDDERRPPPPPEPERQGFGRSR